MLLNEVIVNCTAGAPQASSQQDNSSSVTVPGSRFSEDVVIANGPRAKQFDHPIHVVLGTKTKVRDAEPSSDLFDGTDANSIIGFGVFRATFDREDAPGSDKEIMFLLRKFRFGVVSCLHVSIL
jgi:hypothetical protein